jgi:hypothetical protein
MDITTRSGASRSPVGAVALVCAAVGTPLCLWLFFCYVAEQFGPDWLFQLASQNAHPGLSRALDLGTAASVILAIVGALLGGVVLLVGKRRGVRSRPARIAWYLGLSCVGLIAIGILMNIVGFFTGFGS